MLGVACLQQAVGELGQLRDIFQSSDAAATVPVGAETDVVWTRDLEYVQDVRDIVVERRAPDVVLCI